ncbi:L-2-amino-thiazoline-4-carboxylic acid hydrolase [Terrarubrum flagellatum]|uniref:L-2-amino-thiazoline-4-carboxylic acid hydrolase n=1 Tax=Terrirubrum flagellatum TaxID=2895980 RepID=UPI0031453DDE
MTDIETLRVELAAAFANRADLYRLMRRALVRELGEERAETVISDMLEERGREVAQILFADTPADAKAVAERFLSVSPDGGRLFPHAVERSEGVCTIRVHSCPLKDAWVAAKLPDEEVADLCRLAGAFDKGLFEAAGVEFANQTWTRERGGGCCWITLTSKP